MNEGNFQPQVYDWEYSFDEKQEGVDIPRVSVEALADKINKDLVEILKES